MKTKAKQFLNEMGLADDRYTALGVETLSVIMADFANSLTPERKALLERSDKIGLLERYSQWLEDQGYTDIDWRAEPPYAIDEFMKLES
jgi:hypothetical protein